MPKISKKIFLLGGTVIIVAAVGFIGWKTLKSEQTIPPTIKKQLTFVPFTTESSELVTVPTSVKYDNKAELLTYIVTLSGTKVVISQQSAPENFTDVPQAYTALMQKMHTQNTFDTVNGKVDITKPDERHGLQTAVMDSKGVLMFANPDKNISVNDWKKFFNGLVIKN